jgi:hypothetical protein
MNMIMTLGDILKEEGRSQIWLRDKLIERGIKRDKSIINHYCKNKHTPRDKYILTVIADILGIDLVRIQSCFNKIKPEVETTTDKEDLIF